MTPYSNSNRRLNSRSYYKAPINYATFYSENYYEATMFNSSDEGMYFESDSAVRQGSYIYIKMINFSPDIYVPGAYKAYVAQVRWCRKVNDSGDVMYGSGVRYTTKGILYGKTSHHFYYSCDLCGREIPSDQIHNTEESLHLCLDCFKYIGKLRDGKIKESMLKFAVGNVL